MAIAKLRKVRIIFPRLWTPNDKGKYLCNVLIQKDSPAYQEIMRAMKEAWAAGRDKFGADSFCQNPTMAQFLNRAYVKVEGGLDSKGNPVPDYYAGCIGFCANARKPVPVIDAGGNPVSEGDSRVYDGQFATVSLAGGDKSDTGYSDQIDAASEWADEITPDAFDCVPF